MKDSSHFLSLTKRGFTLLFLVVAQANAEVPQTLEELWADFPARDKATPLDTEVLKTCEDNDVTLRLVRFNIAAFKGEMLKLAGFYAVPKGDMKGLPALVVCHGGGQKASVGGPKNWAMNGYAAFCPNNGAQPWDNRFVGLPNTDYGSFNPAVRKPDNRDGKGRLAPGPNTIDPVLSPHNEAMYSSNVNSWDRATITRPTKPLPPRKSRRPPPRSIASATCAGMVAYTSSDRSIGRKTQRRANENPHQEFSSQPDLHDRKRLGSGHLGFHREEYL